LVSHFQIAPDKEVFMQPAKVDILVGQFCYSGNGGYSAILPHIGDWWAKVYHEMMTDERIGRVAKVNLADTPLTMTRNLLLHQAVTGGFDAVLMIDSDNEPDLYVGKDGAAKPFWQTSFEFAYRRLTQGLSTCIGAPYCGPPPHPTNGGEENVYVFKWKNWESDNPHYSGAEVVAYDRTEAALMTGIAPAAALPTGLLLLTINALESIKPPYFRYEWKDGWEDQKASTEDVYFTRNLAMAGRMKWGAPVVFCNWDAWAGHHKPKCVGKPVVLRVEQVCETFAEAVRNNFGAQERMIYVNPEMSDGLLKQLQDAPDEKIVPVLVPEQKSPAVQDDTVRVFAEQRHGRTFSHLSWRSNETDRLYLKQLVQTLPKDGVALAAAELGSWVGDSACAILEENDDIYLTCVDTFDGNREDSVADIARRAMDQSANKDIVYDYFKKNTQHFGERCTVIRGTTSEAASMVTDGAFDFIYIDAGHTYKDVKADIEAWLPKLRHVPHAIICGHDFGDVVFPGVDAAVKETFGDNVQILGHVWYAKPYAEIVNNELEPVGVDVDGTVKPVEKLAPVSLADIDYAHLKEFLEVWNKGGNPKRILYCGAPDYVALDMLVRASRGGGVFCAVEQAIPIGHDARNAETKGVRFVPVDDIATADFWNTDKADLVFIHESVLSQDVFSNSLLFVNDDGIVLGTGKPTFAIDEYGVHVEAWAEGNLWSVFSGQAA
jgi:predicted O-methyltransferase YrrM